MIDHIVLDIEIQKTIQETPGGWEATDKLGVACAVIYEFSSDRYLVYGPNDVARLKDRLLKADRVSGYNTFKFDYPVIWAIPGRERVYELSPSCDDLLRRIWVAQGLDPNTFSDGHKGWGLDNVAESTIGQKKTGYGGDAPKWFQAGDWARLITYCINDVKITRDLTLFVDRYGFVTRYHREVVRLSRWEK